VHAGGNAVNGEGVRTHSESAAHARSLRILKQAPRRAVGLVFLDFGAQRQPVKSFCFQHRPRQAAGSSRLKTGKLSSERRTAFSGLWDE